MKKCITAALMSLLIFPGTGHVWLQKKKLGMGIIFFSLIALMFVMREILKQLAVMIDNISSGKTPHVDIENLTPYLLEQMTHSNNDILQLSLAFLLLIWIGSALDAFRIGLQK